MGALRTLVGVPLEHPLDTIKTMSQAFPNFTITRSIAHLYHTKGLIQGLYAGVIPNASRVLVKQAYRYVTKLAALLIIVNICWLYDNRFPMMIALPPLLSSVTENTSAQRIFSGIIIASFETFVVCPLERLKVHLQTMQRPTATAVASPTSIASILRAMPARELFRGLNAVMARSLVSWCTFLVSEHHISQYVYNHHYPRNSWQSILMISVMVGAINTALVLPFDFVKTQLQKEKPFGQVPMAATSIASGGLNATKSQQQQLMYKDASIVQVMKSMVKEHGSIGVLFKGWQPRFLQYLIQAAFTTNLLHYYDNDDDTKNTKPQVSDPKQ